MRKANEKELDRQEFVRQMETVLALWKEQEADAMKDAMRESADVFQCITRARVARAKYEAAWTVLMCASEHNVISSAALPKIAPC